MSDSNLNAVLKQMGKIEQLEKKLSDLQEKYERAVEVARFYGKVNHWLGLTDKVPFDVLKWIRVVEDDMDKNNIGGKKAREFLKSIESSEVQFEPCGKCLNKCSCEKDLL